MHSEGDEGGTRVCGGIFSFTGPAIEPDVDYLRWHLMDHMPEQYSLPGIAFGQRWIADGKYLDARLIAEGASGNIGNVVNYLVREPVVETLDDFMSLGARLSAAGRYPIARPALQISAARLLHRVAAPRVMVSANVIPFRPHRGVLLLVEDRPSEDDADWLAWIQRENLPELLLLDGVAGAWMFASPEDWLPESSLWSERRQYVTVVYIDGEPLSTAASARAAVEQRWESGRVRPVFAGPLRSMIAYEAWI